MLSCRGGGNFVPTLASKPKVGLYAPARLARGRVGPDCSLHMLGQLGIQLVLICKGIDNQAFNRSVGCGHMRPERLQTPCDRMNAFSIERVAGLRSDMGKDDETCPSAHLPPGLAVQRKAVSQQGGHDITDERFGVVGRVFDLDQGQHFEHSRIDDRNVELRQLFGPFGFHIGMAKPDDKLAGNVRITVVKEHFVWR